MTDAPQWCNGQRVKSVINGEITLFIGGYYERKGSEITKYYFAGASRIAMRKVIIPHSIALTYLLGDHASTLLSTSLGSTSLAVDANEVKTEQALCHSQR